MEYKVIYEDFVLYEFEKKVREAIALGWKPQGGVAIAYSPDGTAIYLQAMVK